MPVRRGGTQPRKVPSGSLADIGGHHTAKKNEKKNVKTRRSKRSRLGNAR